MECIKFIFILVALCVVNSQRPAVRVRVTQKGLSYAMHSTVKEAREQLLKYPIPDSKGQYLGVNYNLAKIRINKMNISSSGLMPSGNKGLFAVVNDVDLKLSGDFDWWTTNGHFEVEIIKMSIIIVTNIVKQGNRLAVANVTCASKLEDVKLQITGSNNFLFFVFTPIVEGLLRSKIPSLACYEAKNRIKSSINKKFSEFPLKQTLENSVTLDYSVVKEPSFKSTSADLFLKGEFQALAKTVAPWVHEPRPLPLDLRRSRMMYVTIMDHTANSAGEAFFRQGVLNVEVSADNVIKKRSFLGFQTALISSPMQILKLQCPNCELTIQMEATSAPKIHTSYSGINLTVTGLARFKLVSPTNSSKTVLVLAMNISATATPELNGTKIATKISNLKITARVLEPKVGIPTLVKYEALKTLRKEITLVLERSLSAFKIPLPISDQFKPVNPQISYGEHFITLHTDVQFQ